MAIKKDTLDGLLAGHNPQAVFAKDGLCYSLRVGVGGFPDGNAPPPTTPRLLNNTTAPGARLPRDSAGGPYLSTRNDPLPSSQRMRVGSDGVLIEQHRHRIVDMSGGNVSVRVHALQSLNQSLFRVRRLSCVSIDTAGSLVQCLMNAWPSCRAQRINGNYPVDKTPSRFRRHARSM